MSASEYLASIAYAGNIFYFASWQTTDGWVDEVVELVDEAIETPGVDGVRFVESHLRFRPFTARTIEGLTDYVTAVERANAYRAIQGYYVDLSVRSGTGMVSWRNVKVRSVSPHPSVGQLVGYGSVSTDLAFVASSWSLILTERRQA